MQARKGKKLLEASGPSAATQTPPAQCEWERRAELPTATGPPVVELGVPKPHQAALTDTHLSVTV